MDSEDEIAARIAADKKRWEEYDPYVTTKLDDRGPWTVETWKDENGNDKVGLFSDDFTHDVVLNITGDFWDNKQRMMYAQQLADRMNKMPGTRPVNYLELQRAEYLRKKAEIKND